MPWYSWLNSHDGVVNVAHPVLSQLIAGYRTQEGIWSWLPVVGWADLCCRLGILLQKCLFLVFNLRRWRKGCLLSFYPWSPFSYFLYYQARTLHSTNLLEVKSSTEKDFIKIFSLIFFHGLFPQNIINAKIKYKILTVMSRIDHSNSTLGHHKEVKKIYCAYHPN